MRTAFFFISPKKCVGFFALCIRTMRLTPNKTKQNTNRISGTDAYTNFLIGRATIRKECFYGITWINDNHRCNNNIRCADIELLNDYPRKLSFVTLENCLNHVGVGVDVDVDVDELPVFIVQKQKAFFEIYGLIMAIRTCWFSFRDWERRVCVWILLHWTHWTYFYGLIHFDTIAEDHIRYAASPNEMEIDSYRVKMKWEKRHTICTWIRMDRRALIYQYLSLYDILINARSTALLTKMQIQWLFTNG